MAVRLTCKPPDKRAAPASGEEAIRNLQSRYAWYTHDGDWGAYADAGLDGGGILELARVIISDLYTYSMHTGQMLRITDDDGATNVTNETVRVLSGRTTIAYVTDDSNGDPISVDSRSFRNGLWTLDAEFQIPLELTVGTIGPDETQAQRFTVYSHRENDECLPAGTYEYTESHDRGIRTTESDPDEGVGDHFRT